MKSVRKQTFVEGHQQSFKHAISLSRYPGFRGSGALFLYKCESDFANLPCASTACS